MTEPETDLPFQDVLPPKSVKILPAYYDLYFSEATDYERSTRLWMRWVIVPLPMRLIKSVKLMILSPFLALKVGLGGLMVAGAPLVAIYQLIAFTVYMAMGRLGMQVSKRNIAESINRAFKENGVQRTALLTSDDIPDELLEDLRKGGNG